MARRFLLTSCVLFAWTWMVPGTAQAQNAVGFQTPSGNIHCLAYNHEPGAPYATLECDIGDRSGNAPVRPRPADCDFDWGQRFVLDGAAAGAQLGCASDWLGSDGNAVLNYGSSMTFGAITCTSRKTGLTCKNKRGEGFFLSRRRQTLF